MSIDKQMVKTTLDNVCERWDFSGCFMLAKDNEMLHDGIYGFANKDKQINISRDTRYTLCANDQLFAGMAMLLAIDQGMVSLEDTIDKYLPEFKHADKITIEHLLRNKTGLKDYYYDVLMVELDADAAFQALGLEKRKRKVQQELYTNSSFEQVLQRIGTAELEFTPGDEEAYGSMTAAVFTLEILKRVTGLCCFDFLQQHLFEPLGMRSVEAGADPSVISYREHDNTQLISMPLDYEVDGVFMVSAADIRKLSLAISNREILSKRLWNKVFKLDNNGQGILFSNANGYMSTSSMFLGFGWHYYANHKTGVTFASIMNAQQILKFEGNNVHYFNKESRQIIASLTTYPEDTRMVKVNKKNFWDALGLSLEEEQNEFVLDAKSSIAMGLMYPTKQVFVQMEGDLAVGLLVLEIDKKRKLFDIDIVIIDKRFQGKGYGKLMIKWAVEHLKAAGAQKLTIGVNTKNVAAKQIYLNAGFTPSSVGEGGMQLAMVV